MYIRVEVKSWAHRDGTLAITTTVQSPLGELSDSHLIQQDEFESLYDLVFASVKDSIRREYQKLKGAGGVS